MWRCSQCDESVEDSFEVCWNCGAARDGTVDPAFEREPEDPSVPDLDKDPHAESAPEPGESPQAESAGSTTETPVAGGPMNRREIATLICKTLALLMFAQAAFISITSIVLMTIMLGSALFRGSVNWHEFFSSLFFSIPMLAVLTVGVFYWNRSGSIAERMVADDPGPVTHLAITVQDLMVVAFSTAGLFILVDGVREFVGILFLAHDFNFTVSEFWYSSQTWTASIQLGLAVWLILGSRGLVRAIRLLRDDVGPADEGEADFDSGKGGSRIRKSADA